MGEIYPLGVLVDVGVEVKGTSWALALFELDSRMSNRSAAARAVRE